nr:MULTISPECIES: CueP family metal-binding protein [Gracilibacillus]
MLSFFLLLILASCSNNDDTTAETDIKSLIHDYSTDQRTAVNASVDATHLTVEEDSEQAQYELPEDEFFVSIAPYVHTTHPCTFHSLTGCQSELTNATFDVYIEDTDGNVILDDTIESFDNGFIDLWLPRNQTFDVTITFEDKQTEATISTFEDDATCITTMQLV